MQKSHVHGLFRFVNSPRPERLKEGRTSTLPNAQGAFGFDQSEGAGVRWAHLGAE